MAVFIVAADAEDQSIADNLTEVAISRLAMSARFELVGAPEIRNQLARTQEPPVSADCFEAPSCLARIAAAANVRRIVSGVTRRLERGRLSVALTLTDISVQSRGKTVIRTVENDHATLIGAVQRAMDDLFKAPPAPARLHVRSSPEGAIITVDERTRGTAPLWVEPLDPGSHRLRVEMTGRFPLTKELHLAADEDFLLSVHRDELEPRRAWAPHLVFGSAGLAVLSFALATAFGSLARVEPTGSTRHEVQQDLELRRNYAFATNMLLVAGGMLTGLSLFSAVKFKRDLTGE